MDRNFNAMQIEIVKMVALRKESVDRNHVVLVVPSGCWLSLSARRAWIEIRGARPIGSACPVALRKESVDRNKMFACIGFH